MKQIPEWFGHLWDSENICKVMITRQLDGNKKDFLSVNTSATNDIGNNCKKKQGILTSRGHAYFTIESPRSHTVRELSFFFPWWGAVCLWGRGRNVLGGLRGAKYFSRDQRGGVQSFFIGQRGGGNFFSKRGAIFFEPFAEEADSYSRGATFFSEPNRGSQFFRIGQHGWARIIWCL